MRINKIFIFLIIFSLLSLSRIVKVSAVEEVQEVKLTLTDDTFVSQLDPDAINGSKTYLTAKAYPQQNSLILLKFSTSKIPAGSQIGSATLLATSYSCSGDDTTPALELNYANGNWGESTTRWNSRPQVGLNVGVVSPNPTTKSWNVTSAVSKWLSGSANYGFILSVQGGPYSCSFYSKEKSSDAINLVVKFIPPDTTKPVVSQIQVGDITTNSAEVVWNTNEDADGYVEYYHVSGGTISPIQKVGSSSLNLTHKVKLENLTAGTKYYYRIRSKDLAQNETVLSYANFTTKILLQISPIKFNIPSLGAGTVTPSGATPTLTVTQSPEEVSAESSSIENTPTTVVNNENVGTSSAAKEDSVKGKNIGQKNLIIVLLIGVLTASIIGLSYFAYSFKKKNGSKKININPQSEKAIDDNESEIIESDLQR